MMADLTVDRANNPNFAAQDRWNPDEEEQEEDEDDGGDLNIIDKSASISPSRETVFFFSRSFVPPCHAMPNNSSGILLAACRLTGVDVACLVLRYPLLASLADLMMSCAFCALGSPRMAKGYW